MKIFAMLMMRWREDLSDRPLFLATAYDLSSFSFFQRSTVREFITFFAREIIKRTPRGSRQTVDHEQQYSVHVHLRGDGLGCAFVCDQEYKDRVAFTCMNNLLSEFHELHRERWPTVTGDVELPFDLLQRAIVEWQDPTKADKLAKIQADLDQTIGVVHKTIESVLDRGTKLEHLVKQSEDLGAQSKLFYSKAAEANSCCSVM